MGRYANRTLQSLLAGHSSFRLSVLNTRKYASSTAIQHTSKLPRHARNPTQEHSANQLGSTEGSSFPPWSSLVYIRNRLPSGSCNDQAHPCTSCNGIKLTSKTSIHPLFPTNTGLCTVPHRSNHNIHPTRSSFPFAVSVTGSQPLSFEAR